MTQTLSVRCQNCGSPLQVNDGLRYVTCGYCKSELQVVRDASTIHTEVLQKVVNEIDNLKTQVRTLEIQREIAQLDQSWERERQDHCHTNKNGQLHEPSVLSGLTMIAFGFIFGAFFACATHDHGNAPKFFGAIAFLACLIGGLATMRQATQFASARRRYEDQRKLLFPSLEATGVSDATERPSL